MNNIEKLYLIIHQDFINKIKDVISCADDCIFCDCKVRANLELCLCSKILGEEEIGYRNNPPDCIPKLKKIIKEINREAKKKK